MRSSNATDVDWNLDYGRCRPDLILSFARLEHVRDSTCRIFEVTFGEILNSGESEKRSSFVFVRRIRFDRLQKASRVSLEPGTSARLRK